MNNEEFQEIVLKELKGIKEGQDKLTERIDKLEAGQKALEAGQKRLEKGQKEIRKELNFVWEDIKRLDDRLEKQEIKMQELMY